jgi:protein-tyrosine phosphatase
MLRAVPLPSGVPGRLLLHSMPGRHEPLELVWDHVRTERVQLIVSLAAPDEIRDKSPAYAVALETKALPCTVESFPIADFSVPKDRERFWSLAMTLAERLRSGSRVLIHCGAGIGRTGTLAICILLALGEPQSRAEQAVSAAGSHPENPAQRAVVSWCADHLSTT